MSSQMTGSTTKQNGIFLENWVIKIGIQHKIIELYYGMLPVQNDISKKLII